MSEGLEHGHSAEAISARLTKGPRSHYLRDWIYGGIDGAITTFAIVAGVAGARLPGLVLLILGFANLIADGFAMGSGAFSATKSEHDDFARIMAMEQKHINLAPEGEREEIRQIFAAKGFAGEDLERVVRVITADVDRWRRTMAIEEFGLSPTIRSPLRAAASTFISFLLCGAIPLISYLFAGGLPASVIATGFTFFGVGAIKSRWSLASWLRSGMETLVIGMGAAALAFIVGFGLRGLSGH